MVVDAPTPELATEASAKLAEQLSERPDLFHVVRQLDGDPFFAKNGLLFQPEADLARMAQGLGRAGPIIGALAGDPSLRGLTRALSFGLLGVQNGQAKLEDLQRALTMSADTVDQVLAGQPASFSWQRAADRADAHGERASPLHRSPAGARLLRAAARPGGERCDPQGCVRPQARNELSGARPPDRTGGDGGRGVRHACRKARWSTSLGTIVIVLVILWLALHSPRIILAVFLNLVVGFAVTAALGLMMVGALNLISVAFAVLFVGLGVDFGIQFAVRYRSERFKHGDLYSALGSTAEKVGAPLTLAAAAVAAGFLSFFPTDYKGVSELGQIAGIGMLIAYLTSITVLPALLTILHPPGEAEPIGYRVLAPVDRFLERHRIPVIAGTLLVAVGGIAAALLPARSISIRSICEARRSNRSRRSSICGPIRRSAPTPSTWCCRTSSDVDKVAERLRKIPEVDKVTTLADFVPDGQERKLALIRGLARQLQTPLSTEDAARPPTDAQNVAALKSTADALTKLAAKASGPGADAANRLAASLTKLADADTGQARRRGSGLHRAAADRARRACGIICRPDRSRSKTCRRPLKRQWIAGRRAACGSRRRRRAIPTTTKRCATSRAPSRRSFPKRSARRSRSWSPARRSCGPSSTPASLRCISIAILLWIVLRRFGDVLLTLVPLLLAGVVTLEVCVLIGMPLNFANIIALPLLLGVGVAFKIYYIMAWRAGQTNLLQSSLTRAVIWSALTTATAFGSLWLSSHPGTSSMGKLLALSLVSTMCAAVLFQPALMGKPRTAEENAGKPQAKNAVSPDREETPASRGRNAAKRVASGVIFLLGSILGVRAGWGVMDRSAIDLK